MKQRLTALLIIVLMQPAAAFGLTWDQEVTPQFVHLHPGVFSVNVRSTPDHMLEFTIDFAVQGAGWVDEHQVISESGKTIVEIARRRPFQESQTISCRMLVPRSLAENARYTLSVSHAVKLADGSSARWPGTTNYILNLGDFLDHSSDK